MRVSTFEHHPKNGVEAAENLIEHINRTTFNVQKGWGHQVILSLQLHVA